jgi:hypothetical protein
MSKKPKASRHTPRATRPSSRAAKNSPSPKTGVRAQPLIAVRDVRASSRWYSKLLGVGPGRIYIVEPTGPIENDPNLTDKKFPGNPTTSYRSREPLRVMGEVRAWRGHSTEQLKAMRDGVRRAKEQGIEPIDD